ncbi:MAG: PAS domain S-box protein [Geobacteraceae bacterium]|nr:PAS domain S-box protein [Geobacteraceae bacterium]
MSIVDTEYRIVFSNWKGGVEPGDSGTLTQGRHCYEVYYPGRTIPCDNCHLREVFKTGKPLITDKVLPRTGLIEIHVFPLFDDHGKLVMVGEYHRNISDQHRAEVALRKANRMLQAIIDASPLAIVAVDNELNVTLWNPAAEKMFGWQKKEVLAKPYPAVLPELQEEFQNNLRQMSAGEIRRQIETSRMHKDGSFVDVAHSSAPLQDSTGITIGYVAVMADISSRKAEQQVLKESEASYRTIFDAANDAHFVFDAQDATILDVNLKMCEMYGFDNREEALKHNVEEMMAGYPPYTLNDLLPRIWKAKDVRLQTFEWLAKHTSGRLFWMEVVMKGVVIGGEYKVLAVVRDTMERKAAEEENRRMQETLLQANKMAAVGTLASGIAHEINNPNNFILSNAQFLLDNWCNIDRILSIYATENGEFFIGKMPYSEARAIIPEMFESITEGAQRIKGIVTGMKDFSRKEKATLDQTVDVNKVIEAAVSMLHNQIKKHTDFFSCSLGQDIPPVKGNFRQLEQIVVNLTLNALESLPSRDCGVYIATTYSRFLSKIVIKIQDEGVGITEEVQKTIFDPFFTTKLDSGGTGLGLSICFSIVKEHNGMILCESKPGEGTTFLVRIPVIESEKRR